jgi:8-oxo-dGTP diphosphatase
MSFTYKYPRPCVTTDNLIFKKIDGNWHLLLIERGNEPFKGCWALPGGFLEMEEDLDTCAARELQEETGLTGIELHQLYAFGAPNRDPRHRTISVAYWGVDNSERQAVGSDDAAEARWFTLDNLPSLAFDHELILQKALSDNEVKEVLTE